VTPVSWIVSFFFLISKFCYLYNFIAVDWREKYRTSTATRDYSSHMWKFYGADRKFFKLHIFLTVLLNVFLKAISMGNLSLGSMPSILNCNISLMSTVQEICRVFSSPTSNSQSSLVLPSLGYFVRGKVENLLLLLHGGLPELAHVDWSLCTSLFVRLPNICLTSSPIVQLLETPVSCRYS